MGREGEGEGRGYHRMIGNIKAKNYEMKKGENWGPHKFEIDFLFKKYILRGGATLTPYISNTIYINVPISENIEYIFLPPNKIKCKFKDFYVNIKKYRKILKYTK